MIRKEKKERKSDYLGLLINSIISICKSFYQILNIMIFKLYQAY